MTEPTPIQTPVDRTLLASLRAGDTVLITGDFLVFRDQVHRELAAMLDAGLPLPVDLRDAVVYYCGPTPARGGRPVGAAGPTTASRMDAFTPRLLEAGVAATIGKGDRSPEVRSGGPHAPWPRRVARIVGSLCLRSPPVGHRG